MLNADHLKFPDDSRITAENFAELVKMIDRGTISGAAAKQVFKEMYLNGGEPDSIMKDLGLVQVNDESLN